jgi:sec-independent protein translocase protein TatA
MGAEAPWHWVILGIVVIALFGYKKLPDAARAAGRSLRIFKTEIKGMSEDDKARTDAKAAAEQSKPADDVPPSQAEPVEPTQTAATPTRAMPGTPPAAE